MSTETKYSGGRLRYSELRPNQPTDEQIKIADAAYSLCLKMAHHGQAVDEMVVMEILNQTGLPIDLQMAVVFRIGISYGIILQGGKP